MTSGSLRLSIHFQLLAVVVLMSAQLTRGFRCILYQPILRKLPLWQQSKIGGQSAVAIHAARFHLSARASNGDSKSSGGENRGRGPRNRKLSQNEEEELFAALTSQDPQKEGKASKTGEGGGSEEGEYEAPVIDWDSTPSATVLEALKDLKVPRLEPKVAEEEQGAAGGKKKKEWSIDTEWSSGKPVLTAKGRKAPTPRLDMTRFDSDRDLPSRVTPIKAKGKGKEKSVVMELRGSDDGELDLRSLDKMTKIRVVDISNMDAEEEGEGGEFSENEFDEDDFEDDDFDEDEEEEDVVLPAPGQRLSMEQRLSLASKGAILNPYVGDGEERKRGARRQGGRDEEEDEDEEEGEMESRRYDSNGEEDEPVKYQYKIVVDVGTCPGCGNSFQTKTESSPGFLPREVYDRLQRRAAVGGGGLGNTGSAKKGRSVTEMEDDEDAELSAEQEVELLIRARTDPEVLWKLQEEAALRSAAAEAKRAKEQEAGLGKGREEEEDDDPSRQVICQRCYRLKHYGLVEDALRPGWSDNELLTPERFREMVSVVRRKRCAVVCLIDIFDFHGSLLYNLPRIVGDNPVLVAVNKADLLPSDFKEERVRIWVKQQLDKIGLKDVTTRDVFLISGKSGMGVRPLLRHMKTMAKLRKRDLYVIGAANVGKSTFINRLIEEGRSGGAKTFKKKKPKGKEATGSLVTTSALPGTTLNFIEVDLGDKVSLFDTPGLIIPHQLTTKLNTDELRAVIPQKRINHVTLRLGEGKSVLLGGLARLDFVTGRPFLFTFYVSNDVKLHLTGTDRADEFLDKHLGSELIFPPFSKERLGELGTWVPREFNITGGGWKTSATDIVISGLGWISVTGALDCTVRVMVPEHVGVRLRDPLMPYETWDTTARWTGLRAIKSAKKKGGSR